MSETALSSLPPAAPHFPVGRAPDRHFKYWIIAPAIFLLLLVGLFPLVYNLTPCPITVTYTSFAGLSNYIALFHDRRLWQSILHTAIITVIALPLELVFGLMMAQLFLDPMPGRQVFIVDTHVNLDPSAEQLAEITELAAEQLRAVGAAARQRTQWPKLPRWYS